MKIEAVSNYRRARREADLILADKERPGGPNWIIGSDLADYGLSFRYVLDPVPLVTYVEDIARDKPNASVLDVMANDAAVGEAVHEHGFNFGLAVDLGTPPKYPDDPRIVQIKGDVLRRKTWREVSNTMKEHEVNAFDLILSRPYLGSCNIARTPGIYFHVLQKMWNRLNPDGGRMLLQLYPEPLPTMFKAWTRTAEDHNIPLKTGDPYAAELVRLPESPVRLPWKLHRDDNGKRESWWRTRP